MRRLITTPIFYVNAKPHIGHAYTAVLADSLARYQRMLGNDVLFVTGTDEHGAKVARAASDHPHLTTIQYCDQVSGHFRSLFDTLQISYDDFIRTTETRHQDQVRSVWAKLKEDGWFYPSVYAGFYCEREEAFVSDHDEHSSSTTWVEENTTMFDMLRAYPHLKSWLAENHVIPGHRQAELVSFLDEGKLRNLSVTRPVKRMPFGINAPDDPGNKIYVWLDALMSYLTAGNKYWPPHIQVVGKDILRFHGLYWPAFLHALGLEGPDKLIVHGHWTFNGQKMSKSVGNVVDPLDVIEKYGVDAFRYFLLSESTLKEDSNFVENRVIEKAETHLADTLGNLISRCTAKSLNPKQAWPAPKHASITGHPLLIEASSVREQVDSCMSEANLRGLVDTCMGLCRSANRYFETEQPWTFEKGDPKLDVVLYSVLECVRIASIGLQPVIPDVSSQILDRLAVEDRKAVDMQVQWKPGHLTADFTNFKGFSVFQKKPKYD